MRWSPSVTVCLGQNFRGLIAANEIAKVHQNLKEAVFVFSSIVNASIKVLFGMIFSPDEAVLNLVEDIIILLWSARQTCTFCC